MDAETEELDQRIELRRHTETADDTGTLVPVITTFATVWAKVRPMSGAERDRAQQTEARSNYVIILRYRTDVTVKDSILWRGKQLNIRAVDDAGPRPRFYKLEAELNAPQ